MTTSDADASNPSPRGLTRRTFVSAALAAPAVAAAPALLASGPAAHAATPQYGSFDPAAARFALAVLPDTQYLFDDGGSDPSPVEATFAHLLRSRVQDNIAFMTHLGDVTEHGTEAEISRADRSFRALDHGRFPYSVLAGNHDVSDDDQRGDTPYLRAFGPRRFRSVSTFGGSSPDGYNSYHVLEAGGRRWLVLALDWRLSDGGVAWVDGVLASHPTLPTIVTTHELAYAGDSGEAELSEYGQFLWDAVIRGNDQIFLTLNGHYWPPGRTVLTNDAGHDVHVHITNYQDRYYGGGGMVRMYGFDLARGVIDVSTFSPYFEGIRPFRRNELEAETLELTTDVDRFTLEIDFDARFAGFAPVVPVPSRPAAAALVRGTVAYWRFDAEGLSGTPADGAPVGAGTVVKDLSGRGNDLTVRILHDSSPSVLTWSAEHAERQPAHASLRFDGGQSPNRAAVLETGPDAPINSARFLTGYTIEAFIKLPDPFEGNHGFMGLLSWEGRAGDAGKTNGYSPDEPTCSINLSGERFLQYVVYPSRQDASPTSWSHALPVGRWQHIAVVNNGSATVVYVDGSEIARNARARSSGIATLGKPFVIGGTQWAGQFEQGWYGWVGDVRITARPLRPRDFLAGYDG